MDKTNWKWQIQNRITDLEGLIANIPLSEQEIEIFNKADSLFDFAVTPYYLSLVDKENPNCPIRKQIVPSSGELIKKHYEVEDPLGEESFMPVKGVTHRYPDRALWYLSHMCAVFCRFCTRKRKVGTSQSTPGNQDWENALEYFKNHPEIKEVILSGGDPLSLSDNQINYLLSELKKISHINQVRIHTRYPVTLPYRITDELVSVFSSHFPIFMVTHFNHANEITEESRIAIKKLIQKGNVCLLNQSVLLKGVNDKVEDIRNLNYKLVNAGVKPYYLHQCDDVFGSSHFKVDIQEGLKIMKSLRGFMSGITIPSYMVDLTGGGGKVPLPTDYLQKEDMESYVFHNYQGREFVRAK
ncbi:MAG: KamA family radical SAM protein [Spirochaetia bacterium]|nr:KamA family radical SAM protein [Spirochaetia bacterium]